MAVSKTFPEHHAIVERIRTWPTEPGVYLMRDAAGRILYVGKAKNLRNRIKSYFLNVDKITGKTRVLVKRVCEVEFTTTPSELDALLLECNLIKQHRPRYNVRLKDDKNYPYVVLDFRHPFPQLRVTRRVFVSPHLKYFGPFSAGVTEIGRFLLKTFQIRDCSDSKFNNRTRPCLNYEIGTCTGPCVSLVSQEDYGKQIREAILFLKGKNSELLLTMREQMLAASEATLYERAKVLRDKISAIEKLTEKQSAVLAEQTDDVDVVGLFVGGNEIQWVVLFIRSGLLTGRRAERTPVILDSVEETTRSFLEQFYTISIIPDEIWVMSDFPGRDILETFLTERAQKKVAVRVRRGERALRLLGMAQENAKLVYHENEKKGLAPAAELARALGLSEPPHTIEGFDVSNIQGTSPAVALVHFAAERPLKSRYRIYYPQTVEGQDDFGMIYETVKRRYGKKENPPPDLIMIDGGIGQLNSAVKALKELGLEVPICSLAKARTERGFHKKEVSSTEERVFLPGRKNPLNLKSDNTGLRLLQQVRDEAHRFSVKGHRTRRRKAAFEDSVLMAIEGIGPKTQSKLLQTFGGLQQIFQATDAELKATGLSQKQISALRQQPQAREEE